MLLGNSYIRIRIILPVISLCMFFFLSDLVHAVSLLNDASQITVLTHQLRCDVWVQRKGEVWDVDLYCDCIKSQRNMVQFIAWCHSLPTFRTSNDVGGVVAEYGADKC